MKKIKEEIRKHRHFYVNDVLKFGFFFDPAIVDKKVIVDEFLKCRDFKSLADYCGWKVLKTSISDDLMRVDLEVKEEKDKE